MPWPGVFPFGRPSMARSPRRPNGRSDAFVLGVYTSALHVRWTPPAWHAGSSERSVAAIAVDVEPVDFWDGTTPDADGLIADWINAVGFAAGDDRGCDGHVAGIHLNGSSGASVTKLTLEPLGLDPTRVWMTDAVPWFFVKYGSRASASRATCSTTFTTRTPQPPDEPGPTCRSARHRTLW